MCSPAIASTWASPASRSACSSSAEMAPRSPVISAEAIPPVLPGRTAWIRCVIRQRNVATVSATWSLKPIRGLRRDRFGSAVGIADRADTEVISLPAEVVGARRGGSGRRHQDRRQAHPLPGHEAPVWLRTETRTAARCTVRRQPPHRDMAETNRARSPCCWMDSMRPSRPTGPIRYASTGACTAIRPELGRAEAERKRRQQGQADPQQVGLGIVATTRRPASAPKQTPPRTSPAPLSTRNRARARPNRERQPQRPAERGPPGPAAAESR